jgi:DNA-binding NarL/FixJ family response regulator
MCLPWVAAMQREPALVAASSVDGMSDSSREFHKPVRRPAEVFDRAFSAEDPAEVSRAAHTTAHALLARVRADPDGAIVDRLVSFTDEHGIDDLAELWSRSPSRSLPGALWRLYLVQLMIHDDPRTAALLYERGRAELGSADDVVAGAPSPAGPEELVALVDTILRGLFEGDFAVALDRAAAICRVQASGATHVADDYEATERERASAFTSRAVRLSDYAGDLSACAALWRRDALS